MHFYALNGLLGLDHIIMFREKVSTGPPAEQAFILTPNFALKVSLMFKEVFSAVKVFEKVLGVWGQVAMG